jgi:hypothetical protein
MHNFLPASSMLNIQVLHSSGVNIGFQKLIKKHAKWCRLSPNSPLSLSSQFLPNLETQHPFHRRVNFQHITRELSALYNARLDPDSPPSTDRQSTFITLQDDAHTTLQSKVTYWVHSDNQVETELFLLKHLTLQLSETSGAITRATKMAFLDSRDWGVYKEVLQGGQGAVVIWEEGSRRMDVVFSVPGVGDLSIRRKNLGSFLYEKGDLDFTTEDWRMDDSPTEEWIATATKIRNYIQSRDLYPGTPPFLQSLSLSFSNVDVSNPHLSRTNRLHQSLPRHNNSHNIPHLREHRQTNLCHPSPSRDGHFHHQRRPCKPRRPQEYIPSCGITSSLGGGFTAVVGGIKYESFD